jgi:hypothetical protein
VGIGGLVSSVIEVGGDSFLVACGGIVAESVGLAVGDTGVNVHGLGVCVGDLGGVALAIAVKVAA